MRLTGMGAHHGRRIAALKGVIPLEQFPLLFDEFRARRFKLWSTGHVDGFGAAEFHCRWDGRANTLTLIRETYWNAQ
jgi:hypothetical protein